MARYSRNARLDVESVNGLFQCLRFWPLGIGSAIRVVSVGGFAFHGLTCLTPVIQPTVLLYLRVECLVGGRRNT